MRTQTGIRTNNGKRSTGRDQAQAAFVRNVSHELRTPLTLIQGYVELLNDGELGTLAPEQQHALYLVVNHVRELRTLVERVSVLTAIESGEAVLQQVDLNGIVTQVIKAQPDPNASDLRLHLNLRSGLPLLWGDPYHLEQAVESLVENAYKFTPAGGQIWISTWAEPGWVCLAVRDSGIGITEEEIAKILSTDFYQVDGSTTRRYRGLGLGLTVVRAVAANLQGRFEIESQPGQGSRFLLRLPVAAAPTDQTRPSSPERESWRILIVDDEPVVTLILKEALDKIPGCQIATAHNGQEALQLFQEQPFDLLITDYKMPGLDGITLARHVHRLYPQVMVIMITAHGDHALHTQAARAAVQHILSKPVGIVEIRGAVLEALNQRIPK